jgi:hypothetical protein
MFMATNSVCELLAFTAIHSIRDNEQARYPYLGAGFSFA